MRAILLVLILLVVAVIAAVGTGFVDVDQIRGARAPEIDATGNGIVARGGQAPAFDVETGSVKVQAKDAQVKVPALEVQRPGDSQAPAATNQPATSNGM